MNRREALSAVAFLMGTAVIGAEAFLTGCQRSTATDELFSIQDVSLLNEVADTILPTTKSSPGAKAANIGAFIKTMVTDCYQEIDQQTFTAGLKKLQEISQTQFNKAFEDLMPSQKHTLVVSLDREAKNYQQDKAEGQPNHYFTNLKQLTLLGYFTSEPGATLALRYLPVPGRFIGCMPYEPGTKAWAM
ncbi:gluconate 2-dehydrogenase subunit 3 family protein [Adhaeribacter swui]|uniref:Gluconate 2-dehydrogenase subunit 3 family protein n=1 Tax=Adhaeribacter swui TaxID=2086471 RepID=A0A7G7GEL2_9BACT|nr:gluconate 2-dehydrogenase subunit 3 family protein [Adhaeribacter swui]QNF35596.1 gluconate 2-dehydrogenase subunit 3 family protein [Adhaeribacter swui]